MPADLVTRLLLQNKEFDRNIQESRRQIQAFEKRVNAMGATVRSFVAGFAGMAGVSMAFMDITQKSIQFEKSLSSLRSLTGVSAEEMEFFKQQAIKMGSTSTQTASQVVDAFKLIGSQKPELLRSKQALAEVTRQAIILAEAAGMDVPEAAKALTGSLNQMGESASKAGEYINILAAASQAGSADIPYLTKAIEKSGGAASSVGVSYNELVAAIEAIAPKMSEASEAGTNLRNIFLTLESNADKNLKPSVVGLTKALENLAAKNLDATQMTKMFGKESVTAALAIVNAKDNYLHYKDAITGTNTALEQQKINNDNLAGSINALSSSWEGFMLRLNKTTGPLKEVVNLTATALNQISNLLKSEEEEQNEIVENSVTKRKALLEQDVKQWQSYGLTRKEAIEKALETFPKSYDIPDAYALEREEAKLKEIEGRLKKIKDNNINVNIGKSLVKANPVFAPFAATSYGNSLLDLLPETNVNLNTQPAIVQVERQLTAQKEIVNQLRLKNEVYDQSVRYLQDELDATNKVNDANKNATQSVKETTKKLSEKKIKIPVQLGSERDLSNQLVEISERIEAEASPEIKLDLLRQQDKLAKQLEELRKRNKLIVDLEFNLKPINKVDPLSKQKDGSTGRNPKDDLPDLTIQLNALQLDSIEDYQKKIQDTTLLYNQATTDGLRAIYAQQLEDLEAHLQEMTDVNQGLIDISQEVNNLVQSGVVSAFETIGSAIASNNAGDAMRSMLMGIMDMLKQFGAALVAAGLASQAFKKLLSNPYLAIAAGGALIITSTAAKAALQKTVSAGSYADSGIVPYGFTVGDRMIAHVNGGEMILNTAKQKKLFDLLDVGRSQLNASTINVTGRIVGEGQQLAVILNNTAKKQRRGI